MTAVLISRFLLDLQAASQRSTNLDSSKTQTDATSFTGGTISFARVVGSIGSTLDYGFEATGSSWIDHTSGEDERPSDSSRSDSGSAKDATAQDGPSSPDIELQPVSATP